MPILPLLIRLDALGVADLYRRGNGIVSEMRPADWTPERAEEVGRLVLENAAVLKRYLRKRPTQEDRR